MSPTSRSHGVHPRGRWLRSLAGLLAMVVGTGGTFGLLVVMNNQRGPDQDEQENEVSSFEVKAPKKPKPKTRKRPERKRKRKAAKAPPMPALGANLAGLSFGLPGFDDAGLEVSDSLLGDMSIGVMSEEAVDELPQPVSRKSVPYPARARANSIEGYVTLSLLIDETGALEEIRVTEAVPEGVFEDSALAAIRSWRFEPATYQGEPVSVRVSQTLRFELD